MSDYLRLLDQARSDVRARAQGAGVSESSTNEFIVSEFATATERDDWYVQSALFELARTIKNPQIKADTLGSLLLMPGHTFHQEVTRAIQDLGHPSSVCCIDKILSDGFGFFEYTSSEDGVIAKWFSHALADIGTAEAMQIIRKFSHSPIAEIADEMKYRLERVHA